jgi:hypothetical protein
MEPGKIFTEAAKDTVSAWLTLLFGNLPSLPLMLPRFMPETVLLIMLTHQTLFFT